jgi:hypothetical protein
MIVTDVFVYLDSNDPNGSQCIVVVDRTIINHFDLNIKKTYITKRILFLLVSFLYRKYLFEKHKLNLFGKQSFVWVSLNSIRNILEFG